MTKEADRQSSLFQAASGSRTRTFLLYPRPELAGLIPFVFVRDTRDAGLDFAERFNHFAASPLCGLSFSLEGEGHILKNPDDFEKPETRPKAPKLCFVGPHPEPLSSWNPGEVYFIMIGFYPDAFKALTGIDPANYKQQYIELGEILTGTLLDAAKSVARPGSDAERFNRFQDAVAPLWNKARPHPTSTATRVSDWARLTAMRAAMSPTGKSVRQFERRLRSWAGMSKRELTAHARAEDVFSLALRSRADDRLDLASIAAEAGFADQSHMGRLTRRITGHSPEKLMRAVETEEAYWSYRLVGAHLLDGY